MIRCWAKLCDRGLIGVTDWYDCLPLPAGACSAEDYAVRMDLNLAKRLHQKWKDCIQVRCGSLSSRFSIISWTDTPLSHSYWRSKYKVYRNLVCVCVRARRAHRQVSFLGVGVRLAIQTCTVCTLLTLAPVKYVLQERQRQEALSHHLLQESKKPTHKHILH